MTLLKRYVHHLMNARGLEHLPAVVTLREYLKKTPEIVLCDELSGLSTIDEMRALQEAGIPKKIWLCYIAKLRTML